MIDLRDMGEFIVDFFKMLFMLFVAFSILVLIGFVIYEGFQLMLTPEQKEKNRQQEVYEATPHVYATVDGCTVYTWHNGYQHYFTRCENKTTTEGHHREYCGKACSRDVKEIIETENK